MGLLELVGLVTVLVWTPRILRRHGLLGPRSGPESRTRTAGRSPRTANGQEEMYWSFTRGRQRASGESSGKRFSGKE